MSLDITIEQKKNVSIRHLILLLIFILTGAWGKLFHNPTGHPRMTKEELKFISGNGAVVDMDHKKSGNVAERGTKLNYIKWLLPS